jgi:EAL domain-containing protein (putative c-di-GMP-specific phosphodiesterase class I)
MAKRLETDVIVEGVETDTQKQGLREMECYMYQGFLFSRPVPVDEFERLYLESAGRKSEKEI